MSSKKGVIYILTNPSFPEYVKIGYADDIEKRLNELNRTECTPFAFRVYATYAVQTRLTDLKVHEMIDIINPELRSIDTVNGKKRVREFYAISAEDAYQMFRAMAEIHGTTNLLTKIKPDSKQEEDEEVAKKIKREVKVSQFTFEKASINVGSEICFCENPLIRATVVDNKHVEYQGKIYSLSSLAQLLKKVSYPVAGPAYFTYEGELVWKRRARIEGRDTEIE